MFSFHLRSPRAAVIGCLVAVCVCGGPAQAHTNSHAVSTSTSASGHSDTRDDSVRTGTVASMGAEGFRPRGERGAPVLAGPARLPSGVVPGQVIPSRVLETSHGGEKQRARRPCDGGQWVQLKSGYPANGYPLHIAAHEGMNATVSGFIPAQGESPERAMIATLRNGVWQALELPGYRRTMRIYPGTGPDDMYLNVWPISGDPIIAHFDGRELKVIPQPVFENNDSAFVDYLAVVSKNLVYAFGDTYVGEDGYTSTVVSKWDGATWTPMPDAGLSHTTNNRVYAASVNALGQVWVTGEEQGGGLAGRSAWAASLDPGQERFIRYRLPPDRTHGRFFTSAIDFDERHRPTFGGSYTNPRNGIDAPYVVSMKRAGVWQREPMKPNNPKDHSWIDTMARVGHTRWALTAEAKGPSNQYYSLFRFSEGRWASYPRLDVPKKIELYPSGIVGNRDGFGWLALGNNHWNQPGQLWTFCRRD